VTNVDGTIHQLLTPQGLFHINVESPYAYDIEAFYSTNVTAFTNGAYGTNAAAYAVWTLSNPDGSNAFNQLWITELRAGESRRFQYTNTPASNRWDLLLPDGLTTLSSWRVADPGDSTITNVWRQTASAGVLLQKSVTTLKYMSALGVAVPTLIVEGDGAVTRSTTNVYYSSGLLQRVDHSEGDWVYYVYDDSNRKTNEYSSYLNYPRPAAGSVPNPLTDHCKITLYSYSLSSDTDGVDDGGSIRSTVPRKIIFQVPVLVGST